MRGQPVRGLHEHAEEPVISEAGRRFLADLLAQLTDQQLTDLFHRRADAGARTGRDKPEGDRSASG